MNRTFRIQRMALYLLGPTAKVPPEGEYIIQSPKRRVLNKGGRWIMSRIVIVILIYHRHKPIDSINLLGS
jgi:hypothetical protein